MKITAPPRTGFFQSARLVRLQGFPSRLSLDRIGWDGTGLNQSNQMNTMNDLTDQNEGVSAAPEGSAPVTFGEPIAPFTKQEQPRALLLLLGQFLDRGITFHPSITINYKDEEQRRLIKQAFDEFSLWIEGDRENVT